MIIIKIYTKTGDQGYTSNVKGERIFKGDILIELQGSIDEVNGNIGYFRSLVDKSHISLDEKTTINKQLKAIQFNLFLLGGDVSSVFDKQYLNSSDIEMLETNIDRMMEGIGELKNFIYYSGNEMATYCQVVRSIVRRAERIFARVLELKPIHSLDYQYINRLADYFFTLGRYMNFIDKREEEVIKLR